MIKTSTLIASFIVLLIAHSAFAAEQIESKEFSSSSIREVIVQNVRGQVTIEATKSPQSTVTAKKIQFPDNCKLTMDQSGGKLNLKVEKINRLMPLVECEVNFSILVPAKVDVDLTMGFGDATLNHSEGNLTFKIGSGNLTANGHFTKVNGASGAGNMEVKGISGPATFQTGTGNMKFSFGKEVLVGNLDLKTGTGNATLLLPKTAKIKTTFTSGSGKLKNELGDQPDASYHVNMKSGTGNLTIQALLNQ